MESSLSLGKKGEHFVAKSLEDDGYKILTNNYYSQFGEIDIIAIKNQTIAFVEVKTRKNNSQSALWDITPSKQRKILKTALVYMQNNNLDLQPSFDVAIVSLYKNEFKLDYYENVFYISEI